MTKTLNRYNRRRRSKTQRKRRGGLKYQALSHYPGQIHNFDKGSNNLDALDSMMMNSQIPVLVRHHRKSCPHCEDFEGIWKNIETGANGHHDYSVASLDDWATDHMNKKHYSRHGYSVSGVPTVVMIDRDRVPNEHKGPNTLEALEEFLKKHGMQLKIVPIEEPAVQTPETQFSMDSVDQQPASQQPLASEQPLAPQQPLASESDSFIDTVKEKVGAIDSTIESGVSKVTSALTEPINLNNLFSSSDSVAPVAPVAPVADSALPLNPSATSVAATDAIAAPVAAPLDSSPSLSDNNQIIGAPQVPSIGGRRHRKSKKGSKKHRTKHRTKRRRSKCVKN